MEIIRSNQLEVAVSEKGAELLSIRKSGKEYLYQADEGWKRQAPILFPWAGRLRNFHYSLDGKEYDMNIHGFVRDYVLKTETKTESQVAFRFESNEETKKIYPRDFIFHMGYTVQDDELTLSTTVENLSDKEMPCGLGYHPGFIVTGDWKNNIFHLAPASPLTHYIPNATGQLTGKVESCPETFDEVEMKKDPTMFIGGVKKAILTSKDRTIALDMGTFPNLILWSNKEDQFICMETWMNLPAMPDEEENLNTRSNLLRIPPKGTCKAFCSFRFR